jgi:spermidine synthase
MTPWTLIERSETPDGTRLELMRRGDQYSIRANGELLMNSRVHGSEEALAELALQALAAPARPRARLLVGGLGCGYTLAAALARLGPEASVSVAEIAPAVVRWNRGVLGELNGKPIEDPRVNVLESDICQLFRSPQQRFDVILLDVDNGPRAVARASNGWLYTPAGLAAIRATLNPRGVLAIWSAGPEVGFSDRLRATGFEVVLQRTPARAGRTRQRHWIWLATCPAAR